MSDAESEGKIRYFAVCWDVGFGGAVCCIRGLRKPTNEEAERFCRAINKGDPRAHVKWVGEIERCVAKYFQMIDADDSPVFGEEIPSETFYDVTVEAKWKASYRVSGRSEQEAKKKAELLAKEDYEGHNIGTPRIQAIRASIRAMLAGG